MLSFDVRRLDEAIEQAYPRLFPEEADQKSRDLLDWRFRRNPHGPGHFAVAADAGRAGDIVGMIALIATRLRMPGGAVPAVQAVDTVVDPHHRGQGLFVKLGRAVHGGSAEHGGQVAWGFPNSNAAPGWFGKLEWRNFGTVPFLFRPLRSGYFLKRISPLLGSLNLPLASRRAKPGPSAAPVERFDAAFTDLWRDFAAGIGCGVDRDADYLNWRLAEHPGAAYRTVADRDAAGPIRAFASTCLLDKHGGRICYVMEAMSRPSDEARLVQLLKSEIARAAAGGADVALAWCPPDAPNRQCYRRAGFLPLPERLRGIAIHFGARRIGPAAPDEVEDARSWYLSYLDSDTV